MANRSSLILLAGGVWLALGLVTGCNGVLGIEEAQQAPVSSGAGSTASAGGGSTNSGGGSSDPTPGSAYTGNDYCVTASAACETCLTANCSLVDQNHCKADYQCRRAMDSFGACLGTSCTASDCFESALVTTAAVPECFANCAAECAKAPIFSECELYCGCLATDCSGTIGGDTTAKYASMDACVTACTKLPAEVRNCRRSHCELARVLPPPENPHCDHAVGIGFCADGDSTLGKNRAAGSCDKSLNTFACQDDSECCSGNCSKKLLDCEPK